MQKLEIVLDETSPFVNSSAMIKIVCNFCGTQVLMIRSRKNNYSNIYGKEKFFCNHCIRHNFNNRSNSNVLILSFKGIIGYYYHAFYRSKNTMFYEDVSEHIQKHKEVGLKNPIFSYDDNSYLWFVDFNKIGNGNRKIAIDEILKTIIEILATFNLRRYIDGIMEHAVYKKYNEAITEFYQKRTRPADKRILSPTLVKCGATDMTKENPIELTRDFTPEQFILIDKFKVLNLKPY